MLEYDPLEVERLKVRCQQLLGEIEMLSKAKRALIAASPNDTVAHYEERIETLRIELKTMQNQLMTCS
jgi:hypothetical protein